MLSCCIQTTYRLSPIGFVSNTESMVLYYASSWKSVLRFCGMVVICTIVLAATILFAWDASIAEYFHNQFGSQLHDTAARVTDVAKAGPYFAISGGTWIGLLLAVRFGKLSDSWRKARDWAFRALLAFSTSGLLVQILKHIFGRQRPYADDGLSATQFEPLTSFYEFHSMPSGHSQVLFTLATVLAAIFPRAAWLWFAMAAVLAATRVITLNHWLSDVIVGAAVGIVGTVIAFRLAAVMRAVERTEA